VSAVSYARRSLKPEKPPGSVYPFEDTESISVDLDSLFSEEVSPSGSFYVKDFHSTLFGRLLQALPIPALLIDKTYSIFFANQACGRISQSYEKTVGKSFSTLFPYPETAAEMQHAAEDVFSTRKPQLRQALLKIEENRTWGRINFRAVRTAQNRFILLLIEDLSVEKRQILLSQKYQNELKKEIAERKQAEDALRESEKRFRAIFEGAEDYIFLKDRSLRYTDVNPAGEKLLGMSASQIVGLCYKDIFGHKDAEYLRDVDARVLRGESVQEEHVIKIGGMPVTLLDTSVPLRDDTGEIVGILTIARDISDRKRTKVSPPAAGEYPSPAMQSTLGKALLAAQKDVTVLLTGESGSGKDYLAKFIHDHSDRSNRPYFSVNCAAIAPQLAESELFGHERGAFTGALGRKRGLLELAEGGTLLLNEIGELPLTLQAKLLTFLDTRKFNRVGGEKEVSVNARLIAATNRDMEREVRDGRFRQDLYYRINVMSIDVPPLRARSEDIPVLVQQILHKLRSELQLPELPVIDPATLRALQNYEWPGNVRELRNVLERALILSHGKQLNLAALGLHGDEDSVFRQEKASFSVLFPGDRSLNEITQDLKQFLVNEALRRSGGSRKGASQLLGISRYSLKHYMKTFGCWDDKDDE
jgi:PAS domain S-box-containing protein